LSSFANNGSKLFTLVSNEVIKQTVQNISHLTGSTSALYIDMDNRWKQSEKESRRICAKGGG